MASGIPTLKVEPGESNGYGLHIKPDPDARALSPAGQSDDDIYEDAGDLDFTGSEQSVMLARLPKFLWECWSKLGDDQEITIGTVRLEGQPMEPARMSLMLNANIAENKDVPKEYNMHISHRDTSNTFIFSERDLPGYRQFQADNAPMHWVNRKKAESKRQGATGRRAVPKQTALKGKVRAEVNCQPVENDEYDRIAAMRAGLSFRPKQKIRVLDETPSSNLLMPGTVGAGGDFSKFIDKAGPARRKGQVFKAARMPQNELMDIIFDCFKEYTYWPFNALKAKIQQPDAYLRETLDLIAFQPKSGSHVSQYQLKDEAKASNYDIGSFGTAKDEAAPDPGTIHTSYDGADDLDPDATIEMEDVTTM